MSLRRLITIAILLLPAAEIACFVVVAGTIGIAKALVLLLGLSFFGALTLRQAGAAEVTALLRELRGGTRRDPAQQRDGLASIAAGILLLVPGFITAALGLVLFATPARWLSLGWGLGTGRRAASGAPAVIDLETDQWHVVAPQDGGAAGAGKRR